MVRRTLKRVSRPQAATPSGVVTLSQKLALEEHFLV